MSETPPGSLPPDPAPVVRRPRRRGPESRAADRHHLGYQPALDGLRAVAVTAVLFYHARFDWIPGGFLGVSTFFTLSGFLITSLMLSEWRGSGGISLRRFFSRRFRRLLPASWFTLALVVTMGALGVWTATQLRSLRGDVPWSIAELVNWHFVLQGRSYGAQFEAPSPLEHFWSLAVEQQFYLVLPVVVLGVLGWGARRRPKWSFRTADGEPTSPSEHPVRLAPLVTVLVVAGLTSLVLNGVLARNSIPRAYFGTDTRLAELVAGALLACVGAEVLRRGGTMRRRALEILGAVGVVASMALWATATVTSTWLYPWGLLVTSLASVSLIVGALQAGAIAKVLSLAPVVALGRISYGVYLLHWPVFLWLTPARTGWGQWPLFGLRMAVTLTGAVLMFRLLETPIRSGNTQFARVAVRCAAPAAVLIVAASVLVTSDLPASSQLASAAAAPSSSTTLPPAPVRVLVVGDQLAAAWQGAGGPPDASGNAGAVGPAMELGTEEIPLEVSVVSTPDCGVALGGFVHLSDGSVERDVDRCGEAEDTWVQAVVAQQTDVVVVAAAVRDVTDRRLGEDRPWAAPADPVLDDFLATETRELIARLSETGAAVLVATSPHLRNTAPAPQAVPPVLPPDPTRAGLLESAWDEARADAPPPGYAENDDGRIDRWNQIIGEATVASGAGVLDVAGTVAGWPGGEFDPQRRAPDGVGFTEVGLTELAAALAPALEEAKPPAEVPDAAAAVAAETPLPPPPPWTPRRTVAPGRAADVLVVGDSVAFNVGNGLKDWAKGSAEAEIQSAGQLGCPIARGGHYRFTRDIATFEDRCDWAGLFPGWVEATDPEVVVLASGIWEVVDRRLPGDDRFRHIGEPEIDRYLLVEMLSAIDTLAARGASVLLLTYPHFEAGRDQGYSGLPESDPARVDRLNEIMAEAVSLRPGVATLVDFQGWLAAQPGGELDPAKREDGLHFYDEFNPTIGQWLGPQVLELARTGLPAPADG